MEVGSRVLLLALVLALVPAVTAGAGSERHCGPALEGFCAELTLETSELSCQTALGEVMCTVDGALTLAATSGPGLPGQAQLGSWIELGVCGGPGPCTQLILQPGGACSWLTEAGCTIERAFQEAATADLAEDGCYHAWVHVDTTGSTGPPGAGGLDLIQVHRLAGTSLGACTSESVPVDILS